MNTKTEQHMNCVSSLYGVMLKHSMLISVGSALGGLLLVLGTSIRIIASFG